MVKDDFILRSLELVRVVGREQFVRVYELLDRADAVLSSSHRRALEFYSAGHEAYCQQHWQQAIDLFERALKQLPDDGPSQTMLGRCRLYQQSPPPEDWACVYEPKTK
jgi:adenylate cyclase